ncbi:MAG: SPFH domain-containing protein, partial [Bifidobacteriaceae bacterium]|nr:SPFH domain-containing protein [Bifidobacteriaceae bacterium]
MAITIIVLLIIIAAAGLYTVEQQHVAMVERFGKFVKVSQPGIHVRIPIVDQIAGRPSLRVLQLDNMIQTKTKDNVFVNVQVPVQYCIDPNNIVEAFYKLNKPEIQIKAYVEDAIRSAIPGLTLDDAFEKKDDIAKTVQEIITEEMSKFGFIILKALITEIDPDEKVRASMNDINAAQRQRAAAQELAEADKIKV